jgi:MEMO1 family protein
MEESPQRKSTDRQPVAAGRFYPADKEILTKELDELFAACTLTEGNQRVRAIIAPHAGYIYSGKIAASAYSTIPANAKYKNIFVIGSSHVMSFEGASVYNSGDYITPIGKVPVNREIASAIINRNKVFNFTEKAHDQEHSIEVQLPFIQSHFKDLIPIIPIIIGTNNLEILKNIAEELRPWFNDDNLFVISSDFSHYPPYKEAIEIDNLTARSIITGKPKVFLSTLQSNGTTETKGLLTSMCGWTSGLVLLYLSEGNKKLEYKLIDYCNSGDYKESGKDQVVGYNAIVLFDKLTKKEDTPEEKQELEFSADEKKQLFSIARNAILERLKGTKLPEPDAKDIPEKLKLQMGVFVTLKINGELRGCIGRFISSDPLYELTKASARSSAFEDPRFGPLSLEEYNKVEVEITVLGPLKKIENINEIVLGKHGIYIKKDLRAGTMLPQVATENHWSREEFLGYTSRDKAGIGWDGWKNAEIYIYEGIVLEEKKK